jgi:hypothetical protein
VPVFYFEASPAPKISLLAGEACGGRTTPNASIRDETGPAAAATGIKKPTDTRMSSGQTEKLIDYLQAHLIRSKLSSLTSDVDELS